MAGTLYVKHPAQSQCLEFSRQIPGALENKGMVAIAGVGVALGDCVINEQRQVQMRGHVSGDVDGRVLVPANRYSEPGDDQRASARRWAVQAAPAEVFGKGVGVQRDLGHVSSAARGPGIAPFRFWAA
jgi:phage tail tape-measure protein